MSVFGVGEIASLITGIGNKIFPDANAKIQLQEVAKQAESVIQQKVEEGVLAEITGQFDNLKNQLAINQAEAGSGDKFVTRWRPAYGWFGLILMGWQYMLLPMVNWGISIFHGVPIGYPDFSFVNTIILGILGIYGTHRTMEKINVVNAVKGR
jgi:hypothetical protein